MTKYYVMSATTLAGRSTNRARCFETNAVDIATMAEAEVEATRRNAVERAAGHTNVDWFPAEMPDMEEMMRLVQARRAGVAS